MNAIENAAVLITGANGGLGEQFVLQALERGARTVYAAARTPRAWDDPRVVPLALDVTDPAAVVQAADAAADVDIVINNAGILRPGDLLTTDIDDVQAMFDTNALGPLRVAQAFAPRLAAASGALVNVASVLSWYAVGKGYSMSKAALWSATEGLRLELAPRGVHVMGVYLAYTDTPMNAGMDPTGMNSPADVVRQVYDGLEAGAAEVLADDTTRAVRAGLSRVG